MEHFSLSEYEEYKRDIWCLGSDFITPCQHSTSCWACWMWCLFSHTKSNYVTSRKNDSFCLNDSFQTQRPIYRLGWFMEVKLMSAYFKVPLWACSVAQLHLTPPWRTAVHHHPKPTKTKARLILCLCEVMQQPPCLSKSTLTLCLDLKMTLSLWTWNKETLLKISQLVSPIRLPV